MRTTLTLDDDVAAELERVRRAGSKTFKEVVNEALRAGLEALRTTTVRPRSRATWPTYDGRGLKLSNVDNVGEILELLDDDDRR